MTGVFRKLTRFVLPLLALLALLNGGCLLAVAGLAGAGAAGYVYYNGKLYRDYPANLTDSLSAVRAALVDLQFPLIEQKGDTGSAFVKTRTGDGSSVRIYLDVVPSPIPIEGALTRISVRVGFSGDEATSMRILDQINSHLVAPNAVPVPLSNSATIGAPQPVNNSTPKIRPVANETIQPPLAPVPVSPPPPITPTKR